MEDAANPRDDHRQLTMKLLLSFRFFLILTLFACSEDRKAEGFGVNRESEEKNLQELDLLMINQFRKTLKNIPNKNVLMSDFADPFEDGIEPLQLDLQGGGVELGGSGELTFGSSRVPNIRLVLYTQEAKVKGVSVTLLHWAVLQRRVERADGQSSWELIEEKDFR